MKCGDLISSRIRIKQTDLLVSGCVDLTEESRRLVYKLRQQIESYIEMHPFFARACLPLEPDSSAPEIIKTMLAASSLANVGPMAAVAGSIAEYIGLGLLPYSRDVVVENGGDVFMRTAVRRELLLLAERSDFTGLRIGIDPSAQPMGICTSAGTSGHSLSFGHADAVMIIDPSVSRADAVATAIANIIKHPCDLGKGIKKAQEIGVAGIIILVDGHMGAWGRVEIIN